MVAVSADSSNGQRVWHEVFLKAFESELGVQAPVGFWDPLGFTADGDVAAFRRRRSVELKHGRIAMLATMGYITPEVAGKFPGFLSPSAGLKYADIPNGLAAISKVPALGPALSTSQTCLMPSCCLSHTFASDADEPTLAVGLIMNLPLTCADQ